MRRRDIRGLCGVEGETRGYAETRQSPPVVRRLGLWTAAIAAAVIVLLTLTPTGGSGSLPFWCLTCGVRPSVDLALNIMLFVPLGFGLGMAGLRERRGILLIIVVTVTIEALQYVAIPGRDSSLRDIMANSFGGWIGYRIGSSWRMVIVPSSSVARRLHAAAIAAWLITQTFTAWAFGVAVPPPPWWAQIRPHHDRFSGAFVGEIISLAVGTSRILESDQVREPARMWQEIEEGAPVRATVAVLGPSKGVTPIFIISAGPSRDVLFLAQDGSDALFQIYLRGAAVGLRHPVLRLTDAFPEGPDTVTLAASLSAGVYEMSSRTAYRVEERRVPVSASWGWSLLLPLPLYAFGSEVRLLTAAWLFIWFVVGGTWAGRWTESNGQLRQRIVELAVAVVVGLAVIPLVFGIPISHWSEWLAAGAGISVGPCLGRLAFRGSLRGATITREESR